jgi:peptidoglycan hydrolase CwlO-like protein
MYERIARELENERAAARSLRRELDAVQAQTAEHRRVVSAAAANGISTTDETPAAATPAGRLAAARRTEVGRAVAQHRADVARAAAAQRVPESHASPVGVWAVRLIAVAFVAGLLIALLLLVRLLT